MPTLKLAGTWGPLFSIPDFAGSRRPTRLSEYEEVWREASDSVEIEILVQGYLDGVLAHDSFNHSKAVAAICKEKLHSGSLV